MDPGPTKGWCFSGRYGPDKDPYTGAKYLRGIYEQTDPDYTGRTTVPTLYDKKAGKVAVTHKLALAIRRPLTERPRSYCKQRVR